MMIDKQYTRTSDKRSFIFLSLVRIWKSWQNIGEHEEEIYVFGLPKEITTSINPSSLFCLEAKGKQIVHIYL